ncbi:MAG: hypothetical protein LUD02_01540 [Tannerellaceae bacterium]|nr:hypothetical protein [Tannerellaceae bacterium]
MALFLYMYDLYVYNIVYEKRKVIIIGKNSHFNYKIEKYLTEKYDLLSIKEIRRLFTESRLASIDCIILEISIDVFTNPYFQKYKEDFSSIPCIGILQDANLEFARKCGSIGCDKVILFKDVIYLDRIVAEVCVQKIAILS